MGSYQLLGQISDTCVSMHSSYRYLFLVFFKDESSREVKILLTNDKYLQE